MSVLQNCDLEFSLQLLQIPEGDWKSWTPTCLLLGIHSSLEPMPRCTSGLRQGILIIFKFIIVQKPDLSISPVRPGYRHIKFDYTENTANISTKFWIFLFTLVQKMQRHFPLRECLNLILREAEDMEKKIWAVYPLTALNRFKSYILARTTVASAPPPSLRKQPSCF